MLVQEVHITRWFGRATCHQTEIINREMRYREQTAAKRPESTIPSSLSQFKASPALVPNALPHIQAGQ